MKLAHRLFGTFRTDMLHLLLVGNTVSFVPGLVRLVLGGWATEWLGWSAKVLEVLALGLLGSLVVLELLEHQSRGGRRRLLDIPWPAFK